MKSRKYIQESTVKKTQPRKYIHENIVKKI